ncbi:M15 family metallopeptidase [Virgibacillus litoralis]|uniref:Peptidoglycan L-alanyl-D-glutamate endopeptidase CwlK n=1 Tax=Virgibacillus litoralis TaxID=578221 RepID=A0ABS4HC69_9BACI|nr:M15 family metallopeptidase [Virgibacillus litoralis]MBP1948500.1 peptidoglycan L-alanyl-D-glutamate endopeptidase CwlK [Virgibacillus litoralis]
MKRYRKDITTWILIILFLTILIIIYNEQKNDRYIDTGKNTAPPEKLDPVVAAKTSQLLKKSSQQGIDVVITEKVRSIKRQNKLYEQGRLSDEKVVTYAKGGESYHNYGLAVDYALRNKDGEIIWNINYDGNNNGKSDWFEVAEIAKELGFEWGGDWSKFKDYPHLQMDFGLSIRQLKKGLRPSHDQNEK